jgi:hypothetical protein
MWIMLGSQLASSSTIFLTRSIPHTPCKLKWYIKTIHCRVISEELIVAQLMKKSPIVFTKAHLCRTIFWGNIRQSPNSHSNFSKIHFHIIIWSRYHPHLWNHVLIPMFTKTHHCKPDPEEIQCSLPFHILISWGSISIMAPHTMFRFLKEFSLKIFWPKFCKPYSSPLFMPHAMPSHPLPAWENSTTEAG